MARRKRIRWVEAFERDPMRYLSLQHVRALYDHLNRLEHTKGTRRIFSTDASFLLGHYVGMIQRSNFDEWVIQSARVGDQLRLPYFRVMPLSLRTYDEVAQRQIKFTLHTVLCLGSVVFVPLVERVDVLEDMFGSQNTLVVEGEFSIAGDHYYDPEEGVRLNKANPEKLEMFLPFLDPSWRSVHGVLRAQYGRNAFHTGVKRKGALKKQFGHLLLALQSGRCGLCNQSVGWEEWCVDHIYPASRGGTNTLINLQLLCRPCNQDKGNMVESEALRWHLSLTEFASWGLDANHPFPELSDRTRTANPFGYHFVD